MTNVILYTRQGCHLCEEALAVLERHGLSPRLVDIDADPILRERYNECVPVVEIDGCERFRGRGNGVLLRRPLDSQSGGWRAKRPDFWPASRGRGKKGEAGLADDGRGCA